LAEFINKIVANEDVNGILHASAGGETNKYDFGVKVAEKFKLNNSLITPVNFVDISGHEIRPRNSRLNIGRIEKAIPATMPDWESSFHERI
jgi:dTDP-4-dehydrorhamnose reductase